MSEPEKSLFEQCAAISKAHIEQMLQASHASVTELRSVIGRLPWESLSDGDLNQISRLAYMVIHDVKAEKAERLAEARLAAAKDKPIKPYSPESVDPYGDIRDVDGRITRYTGD